MKKNLNEIIKSIANLRDIPEESVIKSLEDAVLMATQKKFGNLKNFDVQYNPNFEEIEIFQFLNVVEKIENKNLEILLENAKKMDPDCEIGDEIGIKIENEELGRISTHLAKKVIKTRISSEEHYKIYKNFSGRKKEIITGKIKRIEPTGIVLDLGVIEAFLPKRLQSSRDKYRVGERMQAYVQEVKNRSNFYQIILSRNNSDFILKLFQNEVPELKNETITIKSIVREAGIRTKVSVYSDNEKIDPVGIMIGPGGSKIKAVRHEIFGEQIDIIHYNDDIAKYLCNALSPVSVERVLMDTENKKMDITIPDDQLSLAIGKNGLNIRLCSQLIEWKLNIFSKSQDQEEREKGYNELKKLNFLNDIRIQTLYNFGIKNLEDIKNTKLEFIENIPNIGKELALKIKKEF